MYRVLHVPRNRRFRKSAALRVKKLPALSTLESYWTVEPILPSMSAEIPSQFSPRFRTSAIFFFWGFVHLSFRYTLQPANNLAATPGGALSRASRFAESVLG